MEATVYEDSPLADYLEGRGDAQTDNESSKLEDSPTPGRAATFAPRGPPRSLRARLHHVLPASLPLQQQDPSAAWQRLQSASRCMLDTGLSRTEDERFLEHFRYLIIASQLLTDQSRVGTNPSLVSPTNFGAEHEDPAVSTFSVEGALVTAALSFGLAWALHWSRRLQSSSATLFWVTWCSGILLTACGIAVFYAYGLRKTTRRTHRRTTTALAGFIDQAHTFDGVASTSLKLIQEIEVVARGYEITQPLPPISRLEEASSTKQCLKLRTKLSDALQSVIGRCIEAHEVLQGLVDHTDLQQYYEIYDVPLSEYTEAVAAYNHRTQESAPSLTELRFSYMVLLLAQKALLCGLLALPSARSRRDGRQWAIISASLEKLVEGFQTLTHDISATLMEEESREWGIGTRNLGPRRAQHARAQSSIPSTPRRDQVKAQMRRLDAVSNGVRALNAKMHVMRDEIESLASTGQDSSNLTAILARQYDSIGGDLRSLLTEWEQGKSTMLLNVDLCDRLSRSSSGLRSPMSPSPSLGGLTAVDEGPAEALRLLNGEEYLRKLSDVGTSDEEVFEAVSMPRTRMSMTREEKMAKMQEDRRKRATFHEQANASTTMLRELETVIKHRPRGRTTSRMTNF